MSIGLNKQGYTEYNANATPDNFVSGACQYVSDPTSGQFAQGYWTGEVETIGSTVTHNIKWSKQDKAVGFSSDAKVGEAAANATFANTKLITQPAWTHVVKANGDAKKFTGKAEYANANIGAGDTNGDFVYMFLGAQPTKAIQTGTNKLYAVIQPQGNGATNGMPAAIHVAYKVNGATAWTDIDFSAVAKEGNKKFSDPKAGNSAVIYGDYHDAEGMLGGTYDAKTLKTTFTGAVVVEIDLRDWDGTGAAPLDQIQLVIYLAGSDGDCVDAAKNGTIKIGLFFGAQEVKVTE